MRPLVPFLFLWVMSATAVLWTTSLARELPSFSMLLLLSVHVIEACIAANSMEGSSSWTRSVVQRSTGLVYLFQVSLAAEEQSWV